MVYSQFLQYQIKKKMSLCVLNPDSDSPFGMSDLELALTSC